MFNALPIFGLALMLAAPAAKEARKPESIVGEWTCETVTANGKTDSPARAGNHLIYSFSADGKLVIRNGDPGGETQSKCEYTADAKKSPAALDLGGAAAPTLAIYKIEKDMLTLCSAMPEFPGGRKGVVAGRPTAFEAPAGSRLVLMTFKRIEKKKE